MGAYKLFSHEYKQYVYRVRNQDHHTDPNMYQFFLLNNQN